MKPLDDRILLTLDEVINTTPSGIIKAVHSEMSYLVREVFANSGTVVDVGPNVKEVKVGDHVHISRLGLQQIGEENLYVIRESDVLAKYE